jgi:hypothetical protein
MPMQTWAQIFFALVPVAVLIFAGVLWIVRRIAHLEGKVDAILALLAAIVGLSRKDGEEKAQTPSWRPPGRNTAGE